MLTIIASMERELAALRKVSRYYLTAGEFRQLELRVVGVGGDQAGQNVRSLLDHRSLLPVSEQRLLLLGFAGGVDPSLTPGSLAISPRYHQAAGQNSLQPDPEMLRQALAAATDADLPFDQGDSLSVDRPVSTVADKDTVFHRSKVGTVNMEDYSIALAAQDGSVPFLAVRAVLDPASQNLPPYVLAMSRSPIEAALGAVVRPWRFTTLLHLARQMRLAQNALTKFALAYLRRSMGENHRRGGPSPVQATTGRRTGGE